MSDSFRDMIHMKEILERKLKEINSGDSNSLPNTIGELSKCINNLFDVLNELNNKVNNLVDIVEKSNLSNLDSNKVNEIKKEEEKDIEFIPDIDVSKSIVRKRNK